MNFISYKQLQKDIEEFSRKIPPVDAVFGIPRSGLMVASKLALFLNIKLGWVERSGQNGILTGGDRDNLSQIKNILILDDSLDTGNTMENVRRYFERGPFEKVYFGAIYGSANPIHFPYEYFYQRIIKSPRFFEWNMWASRVLDDALLDIDGVLFNEEDERTPNYIPRRKVLGFVTGRLEERRRETKKQLEKFEYGELFMRPNTDISAEEFKASIYKDKGSLFIESYDSQADFIVKATTKPVFSIESMKLL